MIYKEFSASDLKQKFINFNRDYFGIEHDHLKTIFEEFLC